MTAGLYGPSRIIAIDLDENRLEQAEDVRRDRRGQQRRRDGWKDEVIAMTDGLGVDVAIEAVGIPQTFEMCTQLIRPGGTVANVGVHGHPVELRLQDLWIMDTAITTGLVSATTTSMLLKLVAQGRMAAGEVRQPPLQARRDHRRLRHVRAGGRDEGAQGRDHSLTSADEQSSEGRAARFRVAAHTERADHSRHGGRDADGAVPNFDPS